MRRLTMISITICLALTACGKSPEEARIALRQMGFPFTEDAYILSVRNGDDVAVKLFLQAGIDPYKITKIKLGYLGTAIIAYQIDHSDSPPGDSKGFFGLLNTLRKDGYIEGEEISLHERINEFHSIQYDGWGKDIKYEVSSDGKSFTLVSYGDCDTLSTYCAQDRPICTKTGRGVGCNIVIKSGSFFVYSDPGKPLYISDLK